MSDEPLASVHPIGARRRRVSLTQWPITLVLIVVVASMMLVATNHFRRGSVLLSAAVLLAMFLRLLLPKPDAGWLAVRSRVTDVAVLGVLGVALAVLSLWVPEPN